MPVSVKKIGNKYRVVGPDGKPETRNGKPVDGGGHSTKEAAIKQVQAININKRRKEGKSAPPLPKKGKANEEIPMSVKMPKVVIVSDGDFESTKVFVKGMELQTTSVYLDASAAIDPNSSSEWENKSRFSMGMTMAQEDEDGMVRSVTLNMRSKADAELTDVLTDGVSQTVARDIIKALFIKTTKSE